MSKMILQKTFQSWELNPQTIIYSWNQCHHRNIIGSVFMIKLIPVFELAKNGTLARRILGATDLQH